jgi:hypothetical protein
MERLLGNVCHAWLGAKTIGAILGDVAGLNEFCQFNDAAPVEATHCVFRPTSWWVAAHEARVGFLCYETLDADFTRIVAPYCDDCGLPRKNPSNHSKVLGADGGRFARALADFAARHYGADLALYARHCASPGAGAPPRVGG